MSPKSPPILPPDELGAKGEARFSELCADTGLVANPATRDRTGWDFIVQDKASLTAGHERLDLRPGTLSCHVQLKTMATTTERIEVKLSAMEYLAKEIKPSFICCIEVDDDLTVVALYLVHIRGDFLERILKRLREAERDGLKLNEAVLTFSPRSIGQRIAPTGKALRNELSAAAGSDPAAYARAKAREIRTLGFEAGRYQLKTTLQGSPDDLVDAFFDQRPMKTRIIDHTETRFGITLPANKPALAGEVEMRFDPRPSATCKVRVVGPSGIPPTRLDGELFLPPPILGVQRTRIRTAFFVLDVNNAQIKFQTIDPEAAGNSFALLEWRKFFRFISSLRGPDIVVEVAPSDKRLQSIRMTIRTQLNEAMLELAEAAIELCTRAVEIFETAGVDLPTATYGELLALEQAVFETHAIIHQDPAAAPSITLPADVHLPSSDLTMFYTNYLRFPSATLAQAVEALMRAESAADGIVMRPIKIGRVLTGQIEDTEEAYNAFVEATKPSFEFQMSAIAAWDQKQR